IRFDMIPKFFRMINYHDILTIETKVGLFEILELLVYDDRGSDESDGDYKLGHHKYVAKVGSFVGGEQPAFQHLHGLERSKIERRVSSGEHTDCQDKRGQQPVDIASPHREERDLHRQPLAYG